MAYTKLYADLVASSVWDEDDKTRIVWITLLALKDRDHYVRGTAKYLAFAARVSPEECERALEKLSAPDARSRSQVEDGRRIRPEPGGWTIINGEPYQTRFSWRERREYNRQKQAEYRARKRASKREAQCAGARQAIREGLDHANGAARNGKV